MQIGIDGSLMSRVHLLTCVLVALGTHYVFGWQFSILGAFVAGYLATNHPIRSGMLTMVISWGVLIVYNIAVAPTENAEMLRVMGVILGDLPAFVPVAITLESGLSWALQADGQVQNRIRRERRVSQRISHRESVTERWIKNRSEAC